MLQVRVDKRFLKGTDISPQLTMMYQNSTKNIYLIYLVSSQKKQTFQDSPPLQKQQPPRSFGGWIAWKSEGSSVAKSIFHDPKPFVLFVLWFFRPPNPTDFNDPTSPQSNSSPTCSMSFSIDGSDFDLPTEGSPISMAGTGTNNEFTPRKSMLVFWNSEAFFSLWDRKNGLNFCGDPKRKSQQKWETLGLHITLLFLL